MSGDQIYSILKPEYPIWPGCCLREKHWIHTKSWSLFVAYCPFSLLLKQFKSWLLTKIQSFMCSCLIHLLFGDNALHGNMIQTWVKEWKRKLIQEIWKENQQLVLKDKNIWPSRSKYQDWQQCQAVPWTFLLAGVFSFHLDRWPLPDIAVQINLQTMSRFICMGLLLHSSQLHSRYVKNFLNDLKLCFYSICDM